MILRRYQEDPHFIPVTGNSSGVIDISPASCFSIVNLKVLLSDPENENGCVQVDIGSSMQYVVSVV